MTATANPDGLDAAPERFEQLSIFYPMWHEELYIERGVDAERVGRALARRLRG